MNEQQAQAAQAQADAALPVRVPHRKRNPTHKKRNGSNGGQPPPKGWEDRFLKTYAETHMTTEAAKKAGCSTAFIYRRLKDSPDFAAAFEEIKEHSTEILEQVAVRRAVEGSDNLMMFILKARRPDVYRENIKHEHDHQVAVTGTVTHMLDGRQPIQVDAQRRREAARLLLAGEDQEEEEITDAEVVND